MKRIKNLHLAKNNIKYLENLSPDFINLESINLNVNNIADLSPLKNFPRLNTLSVQDNGIN